MPLLANKNNKIEKIIKSNLKRENSTSISFIACIDSKSGIPLAQIKNENFQASNKSATIFSALAAGVIKTGEFVAESTELIGHLFLEVVIRGSTGHSAFIRIQPKISTPEEFILIGTSHNNNSIAQTTRMLRLIGKDVSLELE